MYCFISLPKFFVRINIYRNADRIPKFIHHVDSFVWKWRFSLKPSSHNPVTNPTNWYHGTFRRVLLNTGNSLGCLILFYCQYRFSRVRFNHLVFTTQQMTAGFYSFHMHFETFQSRWGKFVLLQIWRNPCCTKVYIGLYPLFGYVHF